MQCIVFLRGNQIAAEYAILIQDGFNIFEILRTNRAIQIGKNALLDKLLFFDGGCTKHFRSPAIGCKYRTVLTEIYRTEINRFQCCVQLLVRRGNIRILLTKSQLLRDCFRRQNRETQRVIMAVFPIARNSNYPQAATRSVLING